MNSENLRAGHDPYLPALSDSRFGQASHGSPAVAIHVITMTRLGPTLCLLDCPMAGPGHRHMAKENIGVEVRIEGDFKKDIGAEVPLWQLGSPP